MIGNSLVPILTSDNDQGFIITYNAQSHRPGWYAFDGNNSTYWASNRGGDWYGPVFLQIEFPKSIKMSDYDYYYAPYAAVSILISNDGINYSTFKKGTIAITKFVKIVGNRTPNDSSLSDLIRFQVYGFYSPGKFLIKTSNNYIYNSNIVDKNSNNIESINSDNALPEFIEECTTDIENINETFSVIKLVK